ncbi:DMT family transporter [Paraburkholderia tropica]|uniref:Drug/metabolite transporter (DMT)-like permease n=1 Tax=Paraburkholderia tropica TaxID=92647 RepID=A0ABX5MHD6_9BURK|nr:DMT family transporter [Paraburkholderia tropica]MBB3004694.1 drug/metabolite transporter (DMT)-like permease [Paraburkholderia tropica]MBB6323492.1 drug/metabolite transporter (DMT)-like permease [Paraburkholderia tropica]PXX05258.1 drug/metabolite transporter (DMT)-like permease [Paraburkholderia tropica]PZW70577.1 drug/metabolite transporter (DMT)-like permease [Paraburkholderia tropica]QNB17394.1 DMT family transporter [Paraburkholderia tropica]
MNPASVAFGLLGFIWGTNFLFMRWASVLISPSQIVFLRVLFGFAPILVFALFRGALKWKQLRHVHHFFVMSLLATTVYYYSFAKGASLLPSGVAGMLSGAIPLVSFLCAWVALRSERPTARMVVGLVCGLAGVLLIARPWSASASGVNLQGVLYMMAGCASVGCSFVYARRYLSNIDMSPLALSTWQIGLALVSISLVTDFHGIMAVTTNVQAAAGLVVGLGLTGTGVAYILYYYIVQKLGALTASSVTYVPPLIAVLIGVVFAKEAVHAMDCVAMLCILGGVFLLQTGKAKKAAAAAPKAEAC